MEKIYKKDDVLEITIEDMSEEGLGIGKADGYALFVKDTIVGDRCIVKIMKAKKNYAFAHLEEVLSPSSFRIEPKCPKSKACGGCQLQAMSYEAELKFKENKVKNNLIRLGGFSEDFIESIKEPIVGMEPPFRYRNKAQYPIGYDREGKPVAGFYAGRTHNIIPNTDCLLGKEINEKILKCILSFMKEEKIAAYDENTGKGLLRHVLIREGFSTGEIMVCLIVNAKSFEKEEKLCRILTGKIPEIKSICLNTNTENTNVIMGDSTRVLWGKETIEDELGGVKFKISARSFYQINPVQTERLYSKALEYANLTGKESVWDLYCGIGTISLFLAKKAGNVYGVEIIPQAIADAKENARINGITNAEFFVGKAEEVLPEFYEKQSNKTNPNDGKAKDMLHPDVIVVDPPRKGCDEKCLETMLQMEPERIVYVSCDSSTLARDLKILCAEKYELKAWQCYDQFSRTVHVETVALLSKLSEAKHHINVKLDMDELDVTTAETKTTYNEIRDWVKEKYGFNVTNLNIAHVKQKHGIIEQENHRKSKYPDKKQQGTPDEKVKAIEDAMKHLQMI
ncbi:MAG: 23S rRNA (uracil(1939)-C(5))-methyltransferase RlmD [Lachnospiraceae bacterium]|nr:23S rRNA (uracil(1939)-C(5))-methyltransferase RlmD [Lachnospiraceae bacterium]